MVAEEMPPPSTPARTRIQPVIVVPMLAPMIMPMAFASCMMPEFTNPTTITVVAEEDWITAVTNVPSNTPRKVLEVSLARMVSSLLPATRFKPSPKRVIPKRKKARPPKRSIIFAIVILYQDLSVCRIFLIFAKTIIEYLFRDNKGQCEIFSYLIKKRLP